MKKLEVISNDLPGTVDIMVPCQICRPSRQRLIFAIFGLKFYSQNSFMDFSWVIKM